MKPLYEAANSLEAHLILNLLEQSGLSGRIDGELLQGGVGELPTMGFVRIMVEDSDYDAAKKIVDAWDAEQPAQPESKPPQKNHRFLSMLAGFSLGAIAMVLIYRTPITRDGIDYDGDGKFDLQWTYVNYLLSKTEADRNRDGQFDDISQFDRKGLIKLTTHDDDFDGIFETEIRYRDGNMTALESDTTGNGFKNYRIHYQHGVMRSITLYDPKTRQPVKIQHYDLRLQSADVDTDKDGIMDTRYIYNELEDIIETQKIP